MTLGVDLKTIQKIQLDILLEFDRICKKHNIKYQLFAGTLLGAVRHQGFIPWDDDIDVSMLRSEYNKFKKVVDQELKAQYFFQTVETDENYMNKFAKIRRNNTIFKERMVKELDMHHGFYIDIFAFDNIDEGTLNGRRQIKTLRLLDNFFKYRLKYRYQNSAGLNKIIAKTKYFIIKYLPIKKITVEKYALKLMKSLNHIETKYVADLANPSKATMDAFKMRRAVALDSIDATFEGYNFPIPKAYKQVLTNAYGDYNKLPPKEERVSHHDIIEIILPSE